METKQKGVNRRGFLQLASMTSAGMLLGNSTTAAATTKQTAPSDKMRIGFIGVGNRGRDHVGEALLRDDCEVVAICDIAPRAIADTQKMIAEKGKKAARVYDKGEQGYKALLDDKEIDAVVIATPWIFHTEIAVNAMRAGKYVGTEVSGAYSLDECWQLVNTQEETGTELFFLENVCYRRDVMAVLNMVRAGLFGELVHCEGGYQHDLRDVKFNDGVQTYGGGVEFGPDAGAGEAQWRTEQSIHRNGELYPTHGIGPVSNLLNINRGNRFAYLTSMSSQAAGLHDYIVGHPKGGPNHKNAKIEWKLGDIVTTVIKCVNGESVILSHDTSLPRPYSLGFRVQGTKGIWMDLNNSLLLEGQTKAHTWTSDTEWLDKYDHPLRKKYASLAEGAGHGGMDWFVFNSFVECWKRKLPPVIDVYDAATWRAITPLSEASIATGSTPQAFPDFTRGRWTRRKNTFALDDSF